MICPQYLVHNGSLISCCWVNEDGSMIGSIAYLFLQWYGSTNGKPAYREKILYRDKWYFIWVLMDEKEFTLQARNCAERLIQEDWTVPMKHGDACWQRAVNSGIEYKSTSVEGNLAGTSMIRKGQRRRLVKEDQKTEIGQLRILHTRVRSLNFILRPWVIFEGFSAEIDQICPWKIILVAVWWMDRYSIFVELMKDFSTLL